VLGTLPELRPACGLTRTCRFAEGEAAREPSEGRSQEAARAEAEHESAIVGSISVAAWIARIAFVVLLVTGIWSGQMTRVRAAVFLVLGLLVWLGLSYLQNGANFVTTALTVHRSGLHCLYRPRRTF
jgi:hypothetical protein